MKKILYAFLGFFTFMVIGALLVPIFFKGKILDLARKTANENVNAKINFSDDITLNLFSNFPDFTLGLNNLSIIGINEFDNDTLLYLKEFSASLDILSVIKGEEIKIRKISLNQPFINAIVLKNGKANWDIAKFVSDSGAQEPVDTSSGKFRIELKKLEVKNAVIKYNDLAANTSAELVNLNYTLEGDITRDQVEMNMLLGIEETTIAQSGITYLNKVNTLFKAAIDADNKNSKYTFKNNEIRLNELVCSFDGFVQMVNDDIKLDLKYAASKSDFKSFLSLVPGIYTKDFTTVQTSGKLGFNGFAKGTYNQNQLPSFAFNLLVENAMFKYPSLPSDAKNIQINLAVTNPDGNMNNTKIDLSKFHLELAGDPFDAKLLVTNPLQDPNIDATLQGQINLANMSKIVPLQQGTVLAGLINTNLKAKGKVSTVQQGNYEDFDASGALTISNLSVNSTDLPGKLSISKAELQFNPKVVKLASFNAYIGSSDIGLTGDLTNFFSYFLGKGTLNGTLNVNAELLDANQFMGSGPQVEVNNTSDASTITAPVIPANINFTLNSRIKKLLYTNMEILDFNGQVKVTGQKLAFHGIQLKTLGSDISIDGFYETPNPKKPSVSMNFGIRNLDIQKAFSTFNTVKQIAPIAEHTKGYMSASFKLFTELDQKLNPDFQSLFAEGLLTIPNADIEGVIVFEKIGELLKNDQIKKPSLTNLNVKFKVENGRVYTQPFDLSIAGHKLTLSGSTGLDQTINYVGTTPVARKELGNINAALENMLAAVNKKAGSNLNMSGSVNVGIKIGGLFTNPTVSTNLEDIAKQEAGNLKDQLSAEVDKKKKELEAKVKAEAEKLKAEADRVRKEAETKARAEADRLKAEADKARREAEEKAKAESEKVKKKAEEEAKKKLKGLIPR